MVSGEFSNQPADRGYHFLTEKAYLPPDFDEQTFNATWQVWPEPLRSRAAEATPSERRRMAFERYGLTFRPDDDSGKPLQYVVDQQGQWTMNCFACHGGQVLGDTYPGLPNNRFALETLTEDIRKTKLQLGKPLSRMDVGSLFMPLGKTNGTTNAVMFGVALMAYRDADLNVHPNRLPPKMVHHDMDAPPWWHFQRKEYIYIDGFAPKDARPLMQFMLVEQNGPEKFRQWESDYQDVFEYISSIKPPKYPFEIDAALAQKGLKIFEANCAECHGTYGENADYPGKMVSLDSVQTDPVRLSALSEQHRAGYQASWFGRFGEKEVITNPTGYVAPPLDGIWASAPYLHNGSVPTLWHLLHPSERPAVWKRTEAEYDQIRIGLPIESWDRLPAEVTDAAVKRTYFDTGRFGMQASGHDYPNQLDEQEKRAVLEYLKTL
ncbi:MAG: c-type cytochrome [Planctomycetales bacterium]|nr:c-type cytochrome [Planctomycetales bacterium]